eukprot:symbB.v1.2.018299.t1/scaffold1381.1/size245675/16
MWRFSEILHGFWRRFCLDILLPMRGRLEELGGADGDDTSISGAKMRYLEEKVNPVLQEMVMNLLTVCPEDPPAFMLRWLLEQELCFEMFDRAGIDSLEEWG